MSNTISQPLRQSRSKTLPPTMAEMLANAEKLAGTNFFPHLKPSDASPTIDDLKAALQTHKTSTDQLATPFSPYEQDLTNTKSQSTRWLWQNRLPLSGLTLLDGDHGTGKSLLALHIAASVSSGNRLPDGSLPPIKGGVVIVTPHTDSNTAQLEHLTALGADLSRIQILSFIQELAPELHTGGYHPFSLPTDLDRLFKAIKQVDARLVIFDPFIHLLSRGNRWTDQRLLELLIDLNQRCIERDIACLIVRNCGAKGNQARPSVLERSDQFLLSHAINRHGALTQTYSFHIQPMFDHTPPNPHITTHGYHSISARDLIENRPDILCRRLLAQQLLSFITDARDPIYVSTLYALIPHCSPFQIHRSLSDLLRTEQIQRPTRGFYTKASYNPTDQPLNPPAATTHPSPSMNTLNGTAAITHNPLPINILNGTAAPPPINILNGTAAKASANNLDGTAARTPETPPANNLDGTATRTPETPPANNFDGTATRTPETPPANNLDGTATRTPETPAANILNGTAAKAPANNLNGTAARTPETPPANNLDGTATRTPASLPANILSRERFIKELPGSIPLFRELQT